MEKIELKDATGKEVIKSETRRFGLIGKNIGVQELRNQ